MRQPPAPTTAPARPADSMPGGTLRVGQVGDIATLDATYTPGVAKIAWAKLAAMTEGCTLASAAL